MDDDLSQKATRISDTVSFEELLSFGLNDTWYWDALYSLTSDTLETYYPNMEWSFENSKVFAGIDPNSGLPSQDGKRGYFETPHGLSFEITSTFSERDVRYHLYYPDHDIIEPFNRTTLLSDFDDPEKFFEGHCRSVIICVGKYMPKFENFLNSALRDFEGYLFSHKG